MNSKKRLPPQSFSATGQFARNRYVRAFFDLSVCLLALVGTEWLFFATKPSFFSVISGLQRAQVLAYGCLWLMLWGIVAGVVTVCVGYVLSETVSRRAGDAALMLPTSVVLWTVLFLLVDNLIYTATGQGLAQLPYVPRTVVLIVVFGSFAFVWIRKTRSFREPWLPMDTFRISIYFGAWVGIASVALLSDFSAGTRLSQSPPLAHPPQRKQKLPHIVLFGIDGLNASNTSFYGYLRKTTPALDSIKGRALIAENAFSNSFLSLGSVNSVLSGRLPTSTRVWQTGHALLGDDRWKHLVGVLNGLGYTSSQFSTEPWAGSTRIGMRYGFHPHSQTPDWIEPVYSYSKEAGFFLEQIVERISVRGNQLAGVAPDPIPRGLLYHHDSEHVAEVIATLDGGRRSNKPVFIHTHLLQSHCCSTPSPSDPFYRAGMSADEEDVASYDSTILAADSDFSSLVEYMNSMNAWDDTLLVFYSDHGRFWDSLQRVPLAFFFPGGKHVGKIKDNVALVDIAPTILEFLEQPIPDWMDGKSVFAPELLKDRVIFSVANPTTDGSRYTTLDITRGVPAFGMILCDHWYLWEAQKKTFFHGNVGRHTNPCGADPKAELPLARQLMQKHLVDRGLFNGSDVRFVEADAPALTARYLR